MTRSPDFIHAAEAAFIAGISERKMNRVVDEHLMPEELFARSGSIRKFTRLCAAFATFYFDERSWLIAGARREIIEELTQRVVRLKDKNDVFDLIALPGTFHWKVARHTVVVDLAPYVAEVLARMKDVHQAHSLITVSLEVMGGAAVFAGTRVPVDVVLASIDAGVCLNRTKDSYRFLTVAHIQAARIYQAVHPRRGRPRHVLVSSSSKTPRATRVVRSASAPISADVSDPHDIAGLGL